MAKLIFLLLLSQFFNSLIFAQDKSCCGSDPNLKFVEFSKQQEFKDVHQMPEKFELDNPVGKMITFKTADGNNANGYFIKSKAETDKFIFVFHEWWGLNDFIKKESDEIKNQLGDVNILAVDLYDGKVANNRDDAAKYMQSVDNQRAIAIIQGAIEFAGPSAKIGTLGWCFGGGWSLQASIILEEQGKACVMYYGIIENTPDTFKKLNAPVLGIFAEKDAWVTPAVYDNLKKNLLDAGKEVTIKSFNADHAFANPSNTNFDIKAYKEAKELTLNFFRKHLLK